MDPAAEAAYAQYVGEHWRDLVRAAVFLGASSHDAEDIAQTTLVHCYRDWARVTDADNQEAYVYRMLLNCLRDQRRTRWFKGRVDADAEQFGGTVADSSEAIATADAIHRALGVLSKAHREVVVLRYFVQLTESQTAEALGIAAGTAKGRLSRALARLAADHQLRELRPGGAEQGSVVNERSEQA